MSHPLWYNGIIGRLWKHGLLIFTVRVQHSFTARERVQGKHAPLYAVVGAGATMTRKAGETG